MEDEFYNLVVKGNDLKTYIRRFQELAILCPNMVPNTEKLMEVFINGLPRSIEGNVTAIERAVKTLEEAINIGQRLMDQIIKRDSVLETNDRKQKLENERNIINNNYQNNHNNNNQMKTTSHGTIAVASVRFCNKIGSTRSKYYAQKQTGPHESILRDELATLETTLEDIQLSSESSSI
ncbi:hypothetical protein Tco_0803260 [Tanacetum coccineum]|uniref:Reverse transcriptase domain-containing protein n=1 Tax=Tanacetum coccineum TaxID=301880 RepID=A0ABQ5A4R0_9ASTR